MTARQRLWISTLCLEFGMFSDAFKPVTPLFVAVLLHHEQELGHVLLVITHISPLASMTCLI